MVLQQCCPVKHHQPPTAAARKTTITATATAVVRPLLGLLLGSTEGVWVVVVACPGDAGFAVGVVTVEASAGVVLLVVGVVVVVVVVEDDVVVVVVVEDDVAVVVVVVGVVVVVTWSIDSNFADPVLHAASPANINCNQIMYCY